MEKLEAEIKALEADMEASACDYEKYSRPLRPERSWTSS